MSSDIRDTRRATVEETPNVCRRRDFEKHDSRSDDIRILRQQFRERFPIDTDFKKCLLTTHNAYNIGDIHTGFKRDDDWLQEGTMVCQHIIQRCVKVIMQSPSERDIITRDECDPARLPPLSPLLATQGDD